jgi:hypothetical protein
VQSRRGELRPLVPLPGGYLGYSQPGRSLVMFSAPKGPKYVGTLVRQTAADTTLYAGSKQVQCRGLRDNTLRRVSELMAEHAHVLQRLFCRRRCRF